MDFDVYVDIFGVVTFLESRERKSNIGKEPPSLLLSVSCSQPHHCITKTVRPSIDFALERLPVQPIYSNQCSCCSHTNALVSNIIVFII